MNNKKISEQVIRILSSGDKVVESDFDPREIELAVQENRDTLFQDYLFQLNKAEKNNSFRVPREYLKKFNYTVTNGIVKIPNNKTPLELPKNKTIYEARTKREFVNDCWKGGNPIYPITTPKDIIGGLESTSYDGYSIESIETASNLNEIILELTNKATTSIDLFYVPSAKNTDVKEDIIFPSHLINQLIGVTVKEFMPHLEIPHDNKNDNTNT